MTDDEHGGAGKDGTTYYVSDEGGRIRMWACPPGASTNGYGQEREEDGCRQVYHGGEIWTVKCAAIGDAGCGGRAEDADMAMDVVCANVGMGVKGVFAGE